MAYIFRIFPYQSQIVHLDKKGEWNEIHGFEQ